MEKAAVTGRFAGMGWETKLGRCTAAALLACIAYPGLAAAAEPGLKPGEALVADAAGKESPVRMEVQTSSLPRIEAQDSGFQAPRVDVSLFPSSSSNVGAVFGMSGFGTQQPQALGFQPNRASVDLGLRYSHRLQSQRQIDVTAWRRMTAEEDGVVALQQRQPVYGARVEMNLSTAPKNTFALDRGFIGLQLESGARISIKRKDGRPMIYYRTTF
jgi:hypothetical protein